MKLKRKNGRLAVAWTAEERAEHRAVREQFQHWHPGPEELAATGEYSGPIRQAAYWEYLRALQSLKQKRQQRGLSLSAVARRSGLDPAVISRLENGKQANPTLETLLRYVDALGLRLDWQFKDLAGKNGPRRRKPHRVRTPSKR